MTFVKCSSCGVSAHISPNNVSEFRERFVHGKDPYFCFSCFKKLQQQELSELNMIAKDIPDSTLQKMAKQMVRETNKSICDMFSEK